MDFSPSNKFNSGHLENGDERDCSVKIGSIKAVDWDSREYRERSRRGPQEEGRKEVKKMRENGMAREVTERELMRGENPWNGM